MSHFWQGLFANVPRMSQPLLHNGQPAALRLRNRNLDGLGQRYAEFKHDTAPDHIMRGGDHISNAERATRIIQLVDGLAAAAPNRARTNKGKPLNTRLEKAKGVPDIGKLAEHIAQARANVLPRRAWHDPKKKHAINSEAGPQVDFLRALASDWEMESAQLARHFPHLERAIAQAARAVKLYDFVAQVEADFLDVPMPQEPAARNAFINALNERAQQMLEQTPAIMDLQATIDYLPEGMQERLHAANATIRFTLGNMHRTLWPDRANPSRGLRSQLDELRYEACSASYRSLKELSHAYRLDRQAISKGRGQLDRAQFTDPIEQPSRVLQKVYHVRWCLLADAVHDLVKGNRALIENAAYKSVQSHADGVLARRQVDAHGQGRFDL